jgi:hypothetical protein
MKKIVIIPVFCESHLIKYQIPNIIDTINPDCIIYNEGMFPSGPESSTNVSDDFLSKYTLDGKRGFDYEDLKSIISEAQKKYKNVKIILNEMSFPEDMHNAPLCYYTACSNFKDLGIDIEEGDLIYPLEGDVFHHESSKQSFEEMSNKLEPNSGFRSIWIDFLETPYYAEKCTLKHFIKEEWKGQFVLNGNGTVKSRKICIKFGTHDFYKDVLLNFMTESYPMLHSSSLITYHYAWWRPEKFKQLRYDQLNRDPAYWHNYEKGLKAIVNSKNTKQDVCIRPSHSPQNAHHWASYIDIEHPKHVKGHPNYKNYI